MCTANRVSIALLVIVLRLGGAQAQHAGDMLIASNANGGGALVVSYDFGQEVVASESFSGGGITLYTSTDPGFDLLATDDPGNSLFALESGVTVRVELTAAASGASMKIGSTTLDAPGESAPLGTSPSIHVHPEWRLTLPTGELGDYPLSFKLTTTTAPYVQSAAYTAIITNVPPPPALPTPTATAPSGVATPTPTGAAAATCPPAPLVCAASALGKFRVKAPTGAPGKRTLLWKWLEGTVADAAAFGNPTAASSFALCLYDDGVLVAALPVAAAGTCGGKPCWKTTGSTGYKFVSKAGTPQGVTKLILKSGAGKAKIVAKGKGANLPVPTGAPLFAQMSAVTVQLVNDVGACWGTVLAPPAASNDDELFKDQIP